MSKLLIVVMLGVPLLAMADSPPRKAPDETATEALLRVQASGQQASVRTQVQTARERDQSMQRWLDSYKYPIPDFYRWSKVDSSKD